MRLNRRQKMKLLGGVVSTLYILYALPWMRVSLSAGSKAALIALMWLAVGATVYYRRDRY